MQRDGLQFLDPAPLEEEPCVLLGVEGIPSSSLEERRLSLGEQDCVSEQRRHDLFDILVAKRRQPEK